MGKPRLVWQRIQVLRPKRNSANAGMDVEREALKIIYANDEELQAHDAFLNKIQQESETGCVWLKDKSRIKSIRK